MTVTQERTMPTHMFQQHKSMELDWVQVKKGCKVIAERSTTSVGFTLSS
jgi:hypothetical protein